MGPIYLIDERYTTSNSYSKLRELGYSEKQGRAVIDQIAAISLLDSAIANEKAGQNIGEIY
jgi:putative Holliday junction resolvase